MAKSLGLADGTQVLMQPLVLPAAMPPPPAISVQVYQSPPNVGNLSFLTFLKFCNQKVEPIAESDWEVVDLNSGHVEDIMLQQVRDRQLRCHNDEVSWNRWFGKLYHGNHQQ